MGEPTTIFAGFGDIPELEPVIVHEVTSYGWRGLTGDGEVLQVKSANGHKVDVPNEITVALRGQAIGVRPVHKPPKPIDIGEYLEQFNAAVEAYKVSDLSAALLYSDAALALAPTLRAKFNRSMILLAFGRWREGFDEYLELEEHAPFIRPQFKQVLEVGARLWRGEDLNGKRLLVIHAHGFGDTIQCLRYIPRLQAMGADVVMHVPSELTRVAAGLGTVTANSLDVAARACDYFIPFLHLLGRLQVEPSGPADPPYLALESQLVAKWRARLGNNARQLTGIAWSVGKPSLGDYPRTIELEVLADGLTGELHSVQVQGADECREHGIHSHKLEEFADAAALMSCMDQIVTVDTAAVHLAGAIGHPNVKLLLSKWASWRWIKNWYGNVKICRATTDGNWASALMQVSP